MLNVVYLVLLLKIPMIDGVTSISIPQATMQQCLDNQKRQKDAKNVRKTYCIAGVMPK